MAILGNSYIYVYIKSILNFVLNRVKYEIGFHGLPSLHLQLLPAFCLFHVLRSFYAIRHRPLVLPQQIVAMYFLLCCNVDAAVPCPTSDIRFNAYQQVKYVNLCKLVRVGVRNAAGWAMGKTK